MARERKTYPVEFKRRMVELRRAGPIPEESSRDYHAAGEHLGPGMIG